MPDRAFRRPHSDPGPSAALSIELKGPEDGPDADFGRQYSGFVVFCGSVSRADGSAEGSTKTSKAEIRQAVTANALDA